MKYERFTYRTGKGIAVRETSFNDNRSIFNAIERLAELEDKIEQGTLIELPCKVGTIVWAIDISTAQNKAIKCEVVSFGAIDEYGVGLMEYEPIDRVDDVVSIESPITEIGETVFLTREEAEKRLKELQG